MGKVTYQRSGCMVWRHASNVQPVNEDSTNSVLHAGGWRENKIEDWRRMRYSKNQGYIVGSYGGDAVHMESLNAHEEFNTDTQDLYKKNRHDPQTYSTINLWVTIEHTINQTFQKKNLDTQDRKPPTFHYDNFQDITPLSKHPNPQARSSPGPHLSTCRVLRHNSIIFLFLLVHI